jgi:endoglucanase
MATPGDKPASTFRRGVNVSHFMAQIPSAGRFGDPSRFNGDDLRWITEQGFDHIRLPVDGRVLRPLHGTLQAGPINALRSTIDAAAQARLGVILELHAVFGSDYTGPPVRLFHDEALQKEAALLWMDLTRAFLNFGEHIRFELLNEPIAPDQESLERFYDRVLAAIRSIDSNRFIYLNSRHWVQTDNLVDMRVRPDPRIGCTVHYYSPFIFTHQRTPFTPLGKLSLPPISFPGTVPLLGALPEGAGELDTFSGTDLTTEQIESELTRCAHWKRETGVDLHVGEIGVYCAASDEDTHRWFTTVLTAMEKLDLSWAVWDYNGGFGVRQFPGGNPTRVYRAIKPFLIHPSHE